MSDAARGAPPGAETLDYAVALFAAVVVTRDGHPVFASEDAAGSLAEGEALALYGATRRALDIIAPSFSSADAKLWKTAMADGARENMAIAHRMHSCADVSLGYGASVRVGRPDRFWGKPVCALTDGQIMAFSAGLEVIASILDRTS